MQVQKGIIPILRRGGLLIALLATLLGMSAYAAGLPATRAANPPTITASATSAVPLQIVSVSGTNFAPSETIRFLWSGAQLSETATTDSSGAFQGVHITVPVDAKVGSTLVTAKGATSKLVATTRVSVPGLSATLSSRNVMQGHTLQFQATGFGSSEIVVFTWDNNTELARAAAASWGSVQATITVPSDAVPGKHILTARGESTHRTATPSLTVVAGAPAPTSTPVVVATSTPSPALSPVGGPMTSGTYHFSGSLVAGAGAQVSHVDGILQLQVGANGTLAGTMLRTTTNQMLPVNGSGAQGLSINFDANGMHLVGLSTAAGANRLSGLFTGPNGSTLGFWVATRVDPSQADVRYTFSGSISSGPDANMTYQGNLELYGDTYGGLLGFLTLNGGTLLQVNGQDVNGNVNLVIVVRAGTPMFASGTTSVGGSLRGTIAGPLSGDQGAWTATR